MPVLVFRHAPFESLGRIADALDLRGIACQYADLWRSPDIPLPVDQAQAIISLGGDMSANDPLPWLREEERLITCAISSGVPVFGVCLGAQLLAKCLGAQVRPMGRKEIGWYPIRMQSAATTDPLFAGLRPVETVFEWHGDTFDLPPESVRLAGSDICANQAFRCGENLYGVQFHPEVTPEIIALWCREDAGCGDLREAEGPVDPTAHEPRLREIAAHLFGSWCDLISAYH